MNFYLLFLLIGSLSILGSTRAYCQQSRTISGVVKNSQGETIIGANIVEKGTSNGTITNVDGLFTLRVSPNAILKVSYMGYTEQEVNTRNKNKLEIILTEDARLIDEVVVVRTRIGQKTGFDGGGNLRQKCGSTGRSYQ